MAEVSQPGRSNRNQTKWFRVLWVLKGGGLLYGGLRVWGVGFGVHAGGKLREY